MTRIGTLAHNNSLQFHLREGMTRINNRQIQISSGKISQKFSGIATESTLLISLKNTLDRTDSFVKNIGLVDDRLQIMENDVSQIQEVASQLNVLLVQALNVENAADMALNGTAQNLMEQVAAILNEQVAGRYLFAGSATSVKPVDILDSTFSAGPTKVYPSSSDTSYYKGNSDKLSFRPDNNFTINYGITANEPGFEKLMRSLNMVVSANLGPPSDKARLGEAHNLVQEAIDELPGIVSKIGGSRSAMATVASKHEDFKLIVEEEVSLIENVDITEAFTRLSEDQTAIEASFATIARLSELSLSRYL